MYASMLRYWAFKYPAWQRCAAQCFTSVDIFFDPVSDFCPARCLPCFERANIPAKAPTHCEVDVMERITENRPQELRLYVSRFTQGFHFLDWVFFFQHTCNDVVSFCAASDVLRCREVQTLNIFTYFFVKASTSLRTERTSSNQFCQHFWCFVDCEEWIVRQIVLHGFDHMTHGIETNNVCGTEGTRGCTAQFFTCQIINNVHREAEFFSFVDCCQHTKNTNAVRDEVWSVFGADNAFTQRSRQEPFELIDDFWTCCHSWDQLNQVHVAWWVEEVDATKACF